MVTALRQAGFPVTVVSEGDERAVAAMATRAGPDHVVAVSVNDVQGLERPVVVYVERGGGGVVGSDYEGRLHAVSRATASLLWVTPYPPSPPSSSTEDDDDDDDKDVKNDHDDSDGNDDDNDDDNANVLVDVCIDDTKQKECH
jgi:hypothetical protein